MKTVTLNTWGTSGPFEDRWHYLLEEMGKIKLDVICLQEVFEPTLVRKIEKIFHYVPIPCYEAGLVILSRFPVIAQEVLKYETRSPLEEYDRRALLVAIKMERTNLLIVNTHLAWKPEDGATRLEQAKELIRSVQKKAMPSLIAGDFNDTPESESIRTIQEAGFCDLFGRLHAGEAGLTWDNRNPFMNDHAVKLPDRRIDYLFASKDLVLSGSLAKCEVVFNHPNTNGIYPSDHYGVFAEFE